MTNLHEVQGLNKYCGPAVLAAMTGQTTDYCASVIQSITGSKEIKAVEMSAIIKAFRVLRFDMVPTPIPAHTLFGVLGRLSCREDAKYIIGVPRHIVAVEIISGFVYFIDNHTKVPIDARGSARLSQIVDVCYKVTARELPVFLKREVKTEQQGHRIYFFAYDTFKREEDNKKVALGSLVTEKLDALEQIVELLQEHIDDRKSDKKDENN